MPEQSALQNYYKNDFDQIKSAIFDVAKIFESKDEKSVGEIGFYILKLQEAFEEDANESSGFAFTEGEKKVLELLEVFLLKSLVDDKKNTDTNLSTNQSTIFLQLKYICTYIGITFEPIHPYSLDQFVEGYINHRQQFDEYRVIRSFKELSKDDDRKLFLEKLVETFQTGDLLKKDSYTWSEAFFVSILAQTLYEQFYLLSDEIKTIILQKLYFRALLVGAPVKNALQVVIYKTYSPLRYVLETELLFEPLNRSVEMVSLLSGEKVLLSDIFKEYLKLTPKDSDNATTLSNYIQNKKIDPSLVLGVSEALSIYIHLHNAELSEKNLGEELTEEDTFKNDMIDLLYMFGIGKDAGGEKLKQYFSQEQPVVPLKVFLKNLRSILDLKDDVSQDNILEFAQLLHENNFIPQDQDLIIFDEQTSQFQWNEELFT